MEFNFYLNNTLVEDPLDWFEFEETIERDALLKALLPKYDTKLTFGKDGFDFLYNIYNTSGFCNLVELKVDFKCAECDGWETLLNGYIFVSDVKFNLSTCLVECPVEDNNFGARIFNNKNLKTYLDTGKSKNGVDITNATKYACYFFRPTTFVYLPATRDGIFLLDAFRFLVDFMTDGLVGFESDFLRYNLGFNNNANSIKTLALFSGEMIRTASGRTVYTSFNDLFVDVNKKYPIAFTVIQGSDGRPTIKLEQESYFYNDTNAITINNIENLNLSFDNERLYSKVKFGGQTAPFDAGIDSFGQVQFLGFKDEEYVLQGECNLDKDLDLRGDYIVDTNIIEEMVETNTSSDSYDEDIFMVEINYPGALQAFAYPDLLTDTLPMYYNNYQRNNKVAERYSLAGNIALYLGDGVSGFRASKTATQFMGIHGDATQTPRPAMQTSTPTKLSFQDDSTIPNYNDGPYDLPNNRYVSTQDGVYNFDVGTRISIIGGVPQAGYGTCNRSFKFYVELRKYDSLNNLIETSTHSTNEGFPVTGTAVYVYNNFLFDFAASHAFYLPLGYYCEAWFYFESLQGSNVNAASTHSESSGTVEILDYDNFSFFKTLQTSNGGGVYQPEEVGDYFITKFEFKRALDFQDYKTLKADLSQSLIFNHDGNQNRTGWIRKTSRKLATSEMTWELISNINSSQ